MEQFVLKPTDNTIYKLLKRLVKNGALNTAAIAFDNSAKFDKVRGLADHMRIKGLLDMQYIRHREVYSILLLLDGLIKFEDIRRQRLAIRYAFWAFATGIVGIALSVLIAYMN